MTKKTKEEQQFEIERKRRLQEKQMLQLKASNEMLEEAKKGIINRYGADSDTGHDLLKDIQTAQDQNTERAATYLNVNLEDADYMEYNEVNPKEAEAYYKRLENLGKSDELLHMKNVEEQIKMYEESKNKNKAMPTKKPKSKLAELNEKLKKLKSFNKEENVEETKQVVVENNEVKPEVNCVELEIKEITQPKATEKTIEPVKYDSDIVLDEVYPDFDPRDIPSYVQWDMIPLPSKGECYAHKKSKIPVAYLTAADENLISSRNLYSSGNMIDIILERKILDKSIRVSDLCKGDRDAIAIWLRATAYGADYPVVANYKGKDIETVIDLNSIEYLDFNLKGDKNGWLSYKTSNGDILKYKILTHKDEEILIKNSNNTADIINRSSIVNNINKAVLNVNEINDNNEKDEVLEALKLVKDWALRMSPVTESDVEEMMYSTYITDRMCLQTMAVNDITDKEYIRNYILNMRAKEAYDYRLYMVEHIPGVNLQITIPIPESMGGGSFDTFLSLGDTIFVNV